MDEEKAREYVSDVTETELMSNCCSANMYELGEAYICTDCKEYCDPVTEEK